MFQYQIMFAIPYCMTFVVRLMEYFAVIIPLPGSLVGRCTCVTIALNPSFRDQRGLFREYIVNGVKAENGDKYAFVPSRKLVSEHFLTKFKHKLL